MDDEVVVPISALQHYLFCERQCALIHVEGAWADNALTVEGSHLHEKAHEGLSEMRGGVRVVRGLWLRSERLGLVGKADVVEFHAAAGGTARPFPVEYKRGRPKAHDADRVQLCAQALCLEEMLNQEVPAGALFYGATHRREDVVLSDDLRARTESAVARVRAIIIEGRTPLAGREAKCEACSLEDLCLPSALGPRHSAAKYLSDAVAAALAES